MIHLFLFSDNKNEVGEILIKGPSLFKEYWRKPEATEESFTPDGWFITGKETIKKTLNIHLDLLFKECNEIFSLFLFLKVTLHKSSLILKQGI